MSSIQIPQAVTVADQAASPSYLIQNGVDVNNPCQIVNNGSLVINLFSSVWNGRSITLYSSSVVPESHPDPWCPIEVNGTTQTFTTNGVANLYLLATGNFFKAVVTGDAPEDDDLCVTYNVATWR